MKIEMNIKEVISLVINFNSKLIITFRHIFKLERKLENYWMIRHFSASAHQNSAKNAIISAQEFL